TGARVDLAVADDLGRDAHRAEVAVDPPGAGPVVHRQDLDGRVDPGLGPGAVVGGLDRGHTVVQVEVDHDVGRAPMQVPRAGVHLSARPPAVDGADERAVGRADPHLVVAAPP